MTASAIIDIHVLRASGYDGRHIAQCLGLPESEVQEMLGHQPVWDTRLESVRNVDIEPQLYNPAPSVSRFPSS